MSLDFVAVDVETANNNRGSICGLGWAVVRDGRVVEDGVRFCKPPEPVNWFAGFNTALHGISDRVVASEPYFDEFVPDLINRLGELPFVAHNAAFDMSALRAAYAYSEIPWPSISYGCSLVWSRRILDLSSHRLPVVCEHLGIHIDRHHDPHWDAIASAQIVLALAQSVGATCIDDLLSATGSYLGRLEPGQWDGCRTYPTDSNRAVIWNNFRRIIPEANLDADPSNPFFGQRVLFTGALTSMTRNAAEACVAQAGGHLENRNVTKKTSILVLGDGFRGDTFNDFKATFLTTQKAKKALEYRDKGQPLEFWSESDFVKALVIAGVAPTDQTGEPPGLTSLNPS